MKLVSNKRARHDFDIVDSFQAGLVLSGEEVKSLKAANASLRGSFVSLRAGEAWLTNAYIAPYQKVDVTSARQARKLLLTKRELHKLEQAKQNGLHIVPLDLHTVRGLVKLTIATGNVRRKADKREHLRAKAARREQQL